MKRFSFLLSILLLVRAPALSADDNPLKCVQKPFVWMTGQQTRIVIETPPDCGELAPSYPREVEMFDRWPYKKGDTRQRFYFRARTSLASGKIAFRSGKYALAVPIKVLSWSQARQPRQIGELKLPRIFPMEGTDSPKKGLTCLTREELAAMRKSGLSGADDIAKGLPPDDRLFYAMPETTIPRAPFIQMVSPRGCPVCGRRVFEGKSAFYPWLINPEKHPWKVGCPKCERWFPSNDFAAGDMHGGEFPDDGWGYFKPGEKVPYSFIAYYALWSYHGPIGARVGRLCDQYARSGNRRIGHSAALAFFRVAEQYLNLALNINQRKRPMREAVWSGGIIPQEKFSVAGNWLYMEDNWEVSYTGELSVAFEKLWDFFEQEDAELLAFIRKHGHPDIRTMADFRRFIETGYFRVMAQACMDKCVVGNLPMGNRAGAEIALFLNTPRSPEIVHWVLNGPGEMRYFLTNDFFIDGSAFESQGYNAIHVQDFEEFAHVMETVRAHNPTRYPRDKFPNVAADPKRKHLLDFCLNFNLIGRTNAQTGDSGDAAMTDPLPRFLTTDVSPKWFVAPFAQTGDWRYAMALYDPAAKTPISAVTDPAAREAVLKAVAEHGPELEQSSCLLDGYGHAILRSGKGDDRRAVWLRYGRSRGHMHDDMLSIGWEGKQRKLLPELGYPHFWEHRQHWEGNWATHYCAQLVGGPVVQEKYWQGPRGHCKLFADGPWARAATAYEAVHEDVPAPLLHKMVPEQVRERTLVMVDLGEQDSYVFDVFHIGGGTDNYWSFHGPRSQGEPHVEGLATQRQASGTLAGPDVAYGQCEAWEKSHPQLNAFPFFFDVAKGTSSSAWSVNWALEKHPETHVRLTALPSGPAEAALAKGKPPGGGLPYELLWTILHTRGSKPHYSQFVDLIEAYSGTRAVSSARRLTVKADGPFPPVAAQVTASGRVDTVIVAREPGSCQVEGIATDGAIAVWSEKDDGLVAAYMVGGRTLKKGGVGLQIPAGEWRGTISKVDYKNRAVTIQPAAPHPDALVGRCVRFTNGSSDCTHTIAGAKTVGSSTELRLELDPRIGEGFVASIGASVLYSGVTLQLAGMRYYHGKTLTNERGTAVYRLAGVAGSSAITIDPVKHGAVPKDTLAKQFADPDRDGLKRFMIYDYGVGDEARVAFSVSIQRTAPKTWTLDSPVPVTLSLPGAKTFTVDPGQEFAGSLVTIKPLSPARSR